MSALICPALHASVVTVFSSGFGVPETISLAPAGFGLAAGTLVVADAGARQLYAVAPGGGTPSAIGGGFSNGFPNSGIFAPASFGSFSGDYLAFGQTSSGHAVEYSLSSASGTLSTVYTDSSGYSYQTPVVAPASFGSVGGDVLVPEAFASSSTSTVDAFGPSGSVTTFATISNFSSSSGYNAGFGTIFAPADFVPGTTSPVLLVDDGWGGNIDWIDSSGDVHLFATVPLGSQQVGLRQMAFAPAGFGSYGGDLLCPYLDRVTVVAPMALLT